MADLGQLGGTVDRTVAFERVQHQLDHTRAVGALELGDQPRPIFDEANEALAVFQ